MATLTVYSETGNPAAAACDGNPAMDNQTTYALAHDGAGNSTDEQSVNQLWARNTKAGNYFVARSLVNFDTSSLGSGSTITAATISLKTLDGGIHDSADADSISVVLNTVASNTAYAASDFPSFGTTKQAADKAISALVNNAYNDWPLTVLTGISKTTISHFGFRTAQDVSNTAPTLDNYVQFWSADSGNGSPKLVITYTTPISTGNFLQFF